VREGATPSEIKNGFFRLCQYYHPDKGGTDLNKFQEITDAYQILNDEAKRK
jgi:DnaJ-class molecular chaperone